MRVFTSTGADVQPETELVFVVYKSRSWSNHSRSIPAPVIARLEEQGVEQVADLARVTDEELDAVPGIGETILEALQACRTVAGPREPDPADGSVLVVTLRGRAAKLAVRLARELGDGTRPGDLVDVVLDSCDEFEANLRHAAAAKLVESASSLKERAQRIIDGDLEAEGAADA